MENPPAHPKDNAEEAVEGKVTGMAGVKEGSAHPELEATENMDFPVHADNHERTERQFSFFCFCKG